MEPFCIPMQMDTILPAQRWRLRYSQLFIMRNLVSPMRSSERGINPARGRNDVEGKGKREKANGFAVMAKHSGSKFALTERVLTSLMVFHDKEWR